MDALISKSSTFSSVRYQWNLRNDIEATSKGSGKGISVNHGNISGIILHKLFPSASKKVYLNHWGLNKCLYRSSFLHS